MADAQNTGLFRLKTISQSKARDNRPCTRLQAARHNLREQQAERGARTHINIERTHLNRVLWGPESAIDIEALADRTMRAAGVNVEALRRDHAQAIELLFSLPAFTTIDVLTYFEDCTTWAAEHFGADNVLSSVVHLDESAPHCHVLVLPLLNGRMNARELRLYGRVRILSASHADKVATKYGLMAPAAKPVAAAYRRKIADAVLSRMNAMASPCMRDPTWQAIRDAIEASPEPFAVALGLEVAPPEKEAPKPKTMAAIFTKPVDRV